MKMILHKVYMTHIELMGKIHAEFEKIHGINLELREVNDIIKAYEKYCKENEPIPTNEFIKTFLDQF